jgi:hypothetical protein
VTKKALNVRMGKGRGSRQGINSRVYPGTVLLAILGSRRGLWHRIYNLVRARCSFQVTKTYNNRITTQGPTSSKTTHRRHNTKVLAPMLPLTQSRRRLALQVKRKIRPAITEVYQLLQRVRKLKLLAFIFKTLYNYGVVRSFFKYSLLFSDFQSWLSMPLITHFGRKEQSYLLPQICNATDGYVDILSAEPKAFICYMTAYFVL